MASSNNEGVNNFLIHQYHLSAAKELAFSCEERAVGCPGDSSRTAFIQKYRPCISASLQIKEPCRLMKNNDLMGTAEPVLTGFVFIDIIVNDDNILIETRYAHVHSLQLAVLSS